jgi:transcriptional regulator with XRE-family HTH domain
MNSQQSNLHILSDLSTSKSEMEDGRVVGLRVRAIRKGKGWSLSQLSEASDIPQSTLSKFETGALSLPLDRVFKLSDALGISVNQLFNDIDFGGSNAPARRSIYRASDETHKKTDVYDCRWLFAELLQKRMFPVVQEVLARDMKEFGALLHHDGEEFTIVLEGKIMVVTDVYEPTILGPMDGIYIDSRMGHAYLNAGEERAVILNVSTTGADNLGSRVTG